MNQYIRISILTVVFILLTASAVMGQPVVQFKKPITFTITEGYPTIDSAVIGVNSGNPAAVPPQLENTYMPDVGNEFGQSGQWKELAAPASPPPTYGIRVYITDIRPGTWPTGVRLRPYDFRGYDASNQIDSFLIVVNSGPALTDGLFPPSGLRISWPMDLISNGTQWRLLRRTTSTGGPIGTFTELISNLATTPSPYTDLAVADKANATYLIIKHGAFTNPPPDPYFVLNKNQLNFNSIPVGSSSTQSITITNGGSTNTLTITGVTSIARYSIVPNPAVSFPINILPGATRNFDVTFTPTNSDTVIGNFVFSHNAVGGATTLTVRGNGSSPFILNTSSLNFGTVAVGESSTQSITVTNASTTSSISIASITSIARYSIAPNPPSTYPIIIAPGASRNFDVAFTPTTLSTVAGNIVFTHNAFGGTTNLAVTGSGKTSFVLNQTSLYYYNTTVGESVIKSVTITNSGSTSTLTITGSTAPARYSIVPNPAASYPIAIAPGATRNFDVIFSPTTLDTIGGSVVFTHNAYGGISSLTVTGSGKTNFALIPTTLFYLNTTVGESVVKPVTITNSGSTSTLTITSATAPERYSIVPNPPASYPINIAPGATRYFNVTFTPMTFDIVIGNVVFTHNGYGGTTNLPVTGSGKPPLTLSRDSLNFGNVVIGGSATQSITVTNVSPTNPISILNITSIAGYSVVPNPAASFPITIAPGATRNFDVTFTPINLDTVTGNIVFALDILGGMVNLNVTGIGRPDLILSQNMLDFGSILPGTGKTQSVTVTNTSPSQTHSIPSVTSIANYSIVPNPSTTYPISFAPGVSYNFDVTFAPPSSGTFSGNIIFSHDAFGGSSNLPVTGVGITIGPVIQFKNKIYFSCEGTSKKDSIIIGINSGIPYIDPPVLANTYMPDVGPEFGISGNWKELAAPASPPPTYAIRAYSRDIRTPAEWPIGIQLRPYDFRGYNGPNQIDSFKLHIKAGNELLNNVFPPTGLIISWTNPIYTFHTRWQLKKMTGVNYTPLVDNLTGTSYTDVGAAEAGNVTYLLITYAGNFAPPGSTISISPNPVDFARISSNTVLTLPVSINNGGTDYPLVISGVTMPYPCYALVEPLPITVPPSSSSTIHITFNAPMGNYVRNGNAIFENNTGTPYSLALLGETLCQCGDLEIAPIGTVLDNSSSDAGMYEAVIQLVGYASDPLKALQFTLVTKGKTVIGPLSKTGIIASDNWVLSQNVVSRTAQPDGSSIDTVNVLLYGNGTTELPLIPSPSIPLMTFRYNVVNISAEAETTEMCLINILGSTSTVNDPRLSIESCEQIDIQNRTVWGDVNDDDRVDILDLLMVADHITGRHLLVGQEITRANVGEWLPSEAAPRQTLPIEINVLDLVGLQKIIMDGHYPDGTTTTGTPKVAVAGLAKSAFDAKVTFHVTKRGIAVRVENEVPFKALQVDFTGINVNSQITRINSSFTQCAAQINEKEMRFIVFDQNVVGLGRGNRIVAEIQMTIDQPLTIGVEGLIAAGELNTTLQLARENGEIVFTGAPEIPIEFALSQNYPNPFNPNTNITFTVPRISDVRILIYNMLGQEVRELFAGRMERGTNTISWDGKDQSGRTVASGTYIYRMVAGSFVESKKMIILR